MRKLWMPACYYPTTVVLVDDKATYLNAIKFSILRVGQATPLTFVNPRDAVKFFSDYNPKLFVERVIQQPQDFSRYQRNVDINIHQIREEIYNPERFSQVSALLTDYAMPGMNGLEMCREIHTKFIKKVLITGEANGSVAVQAFNDRIIDRFIRKDECDFDAILNATIHELQVEYFQYLSELIVMSLIRDPHNTPSCLDDPAFMTLFEELCRKQNIVEYYLLDSSGSFLFLDFKGRASILAVRSAVDMQSQWEIARDFPTPPELVEALKNRKKLIYLHTSEQLKIDPPDWEPFAHVATEIKGARETFYYAYLTEKDLKAYDLKLEGVVSYMDYLESKAM